MPRRRGRLGPKTNNKIEANKTEKRLAKDLDIHRVPASGAIDGMKGDLSSDDFLLDSKNTGKRSITISGTQVSKIVKEARQEGKKPALILTIQDMPFGVPGDWVMMSLNDFKEMIE